MADEVSYYIAGVKVTNAQRLVFVLLGVSKDRGLVLVKGKNRQGKTSLFNALKSGLYGKAVPRPVKDGEEVSETIIYLMAHGIQPELDDDGIPTNYAFKIRQRFAQKPGKLNEVLEFYPGPGEKKLTKPRANIDILLSQFKAFNVAEVADWDSKVLTKLLLSLSEYPDLSTELEKLDVVLGEDDDLLDRLASEERETAEYRQQVFRNKRDDEGALRNLMLPKEWRKAQRVDTADLVRQRQELEAQNKERDKLMDALLKAERNQDVAAQHVKNAQAEVTRLQEELRVAEGQLTDALTIQAAAIDANAGAEAAYHDAYNPTEEIAAIDELLTTADEKNATYAKRQQAIELEGRINERGIEYNSLTERLQDIQKLKGRAAAECKTPLDGLAYDPALKVLVYNGQPLEQCSGEERITVAVSLFMATNPQLHTIFLPAGSLAELDSEAIARLVKLAQDHQWQVWAEQPLRTGDSLDDCIIIENGEVVANNLEMEDAR